MALEKPEIKIKTLAFECPICKDFGYLPVVGWKQPGHASMREIIENALPCACKYGDEFRMTAEEWKQAIRDENGRVLNPGAVPAWEVA